jgi:hypothetical protein
MPIHEGETHRCTNPLCGCEIEVAKGSRLTEPLSSPFRCRCGKEMERVAETQAPINVEPTD